MNELFRQSYCACAVESAGMAGIIKASLWLDTKKLGRKARVYWARYGWPPDPRNNCYIEFTSHVGVYIVWSVKV